MSEKCRYCGQDSVVPVLNEQKVIESTPGNRYRRFCTGCGRWLPMCSEEYFKNHPNPHLLPIGEKPSGENIIPINRYHGELSKLLTELEPPSKEPERTTDSISPLEEVIEKIREVEDRISVLEDRMTGLESVPLSIETDDSYHNVLFEVRFHCQNR